MTPSTTRKITPRQRRFLLTLAEEREFPTEADKDRLMKQLRISEDPEELGMTSRTASKSIEWLLARPRVSARGPAPAATEGERITEPGVFTHGGDVFVVKPNRAGTRLYAKRLVEAPSERVNDDTGERVPYELEYAPGAMAFLREEHRMELAEGQRLALRYRRCIVCGHKLKRAESVERGIGPVCRRRFAGFGS